MAFPGLTGLPGQSGANANGGLSDQEMATVKMMQAGMESCVTKSLMAAGAGFVLGGAFGLFMASMQYDTPLTPQGQALTTLPIRDQLRRGFREMGARSYSSAKNFGMIGGLYSGVECTIEGFRAKNDLYNSVSAGCVTGGILAAKAGPQATMLGCGGFAAFSLAIDAYMRSSIGEE